MHWVQAAVLVTGIFSLSPVVTRATLYADVDVINVKLSARQPSYSGVFNIACGDGDQGDHWGYDPATERMTFADAWFQFQDDDPVDDRGSADPPRETVTVSLGPKISWIRRTELELGDFLGGAIAGRILLDLKEDGVLEYTVTRTKGDFWLIAAALGAETGLIEPVTDSGGMLTGCGISLAALLAFRIRCCWRRSGWGTEKAVA